MAEQPARKSRAALLEEEYERKLKELQESCPHAELSDWMEEAWAIGHSTDRAVRTCLDCNKVVQVKAYCCVCLKELLDEEIHEGDGQRLPGGAFYCAECLAKGA